ncbi:MAG: translation initiation factor IF-2, partial [Sphingomonadales bacterium]|nr:translation initiation factor IF-2 [Sphingomonadales bacterium]
MADLKLPRLLAAVKEFNIGQDTLIDFLVAKGFPKDDLKPTSKLTEEMYRSLQQEFQSDKVAKMKSDQLELPKSAQGEARKKKEDEEITFKSTEKPTATKPSKKKEEPAETPAAPEPVVKPAAPELEGPKVVTKIDLDAIDSSTLPKRGAKAKKEEAPQVEKPTKAKKGKAVSEEAPAPVKETPPV